MSKSYPVRETWSPRKKRKRPPPRLEPDVVLYPGDSRGIYLESGETCEVGWSFVISHRWEFGSPQTGKYEMTGGPYPKGSRYQGHDRLDVATPEEEQ